ncbi:hypothetical protein OA508_00185 [Candidatus Pelagibacter sp.]|nr:hypothetical protein [Candidatus Pelagibacter sp.]
MCDPTTILIATTVASQGIQYQQAKQQQKNVYNAQKRQNQIARENAIRRYATEQLKIRQEIKKSKVKGFEASIRTKKATSKFIAGSEGLALSGSQEALFRDYYRTQGNYNSALQENLQLNINQFERNLEAIQFGQKSQSTYVQPPNPNLLFVSGALNVANTYYGLQVEKEMRGLNPDASQPNQYIRSDLGSS